MSLPLFDKLIEPDGSPRGPFRKALREAMTTANTGKRGKPFPTRTLTAPKLRPLAERVLGEARGWGVAEPVLGDYAPNFPAALSCVACAWATARSGRKLCRVIGGRINIPMPERGLTSVAQSIYYALEFKNFKKWPFRIVCPDIEKLWTVRGVDATILRTYEEALTNGDETTFLVAADWLDDHLPSDPVACRVRDAIRGCFGSA